MTNFKIHGEAGEHLIKNGVRVLLHRRVQLLERDFPLSVEQVINAAVPREVYELIGKLKSHNVSSIQTTNNYMAIVNFDYPVLLQMTLSKKKAYFCFEAQQNGWEAQRYLERTTPGTDWPRLPFNTSVLDEGTLEKLKQWVELVGQETRFANLTNDVVAVFVHKYCPTLYHLMARWPDLRLILANADDMWRNRIDGVPGHYKLRRWDWNELNESELSWREKYQEVMDVAGTIFVSAQMLKNTAVTDAGPVTCSVKGWKKDGKWIFT